MIDLTATVPYGEVIGTLLRYSQGFLALSLISAYARQRSPGWVIIAGLLTAFCFTTALALPVAISWQGLFWLTLLTLIIGQHALDQRRRTHA